MVLGNAHIFLFYPQSLDLIHLDIRYNKLREKSDFLDKETLSVGTMI